MTEELLHYRPLRKPLVSFAPFQTKDGEGALNSCLLPGIAGSIAARPRRGP